MNFSINSSSIGDNQPVYVIAELSANHNQDYNLAVKTIEAVKEAGANAIKLQTYTPDTITFNGKNKYFQINQGTIWDGTTLHKLYEKAYTPWEWQPKLKHIANKLGLDCFSSPFDFSAVDFLEKMEVPAYKVASFEITDIALIKYMAQKMKPMIISTGIATLKDIQLAVKTCKDVGNNRIALLKCTSAYPTPLEEVNLNTIPNIKRRFDAVVGLSDHTLGDEVSIGAVALGAKIIEKHVILDRSLGGPDSSFSMEPSELAQMIKKIQNVEKSLGTITYTLTPKAKKSREHARSLFIVKDIVKGELFTNVNVRSIRPGFGLAPKYLESIIGEKAAKTVEAGTPLNWNYVEGGKSNVE